MSQHDLIKATFSKCLQSVFPHAAEIVSIDDVGSGVNSATHKCVLSKDDQKYGFKRWSKAADHGDNEAACAERDLLMNEIATVVEAPNHCPVKHIKELDYDGFTGHTVAVTRWLPKAVSFLEMPAEVLKKIQSNGELFFYQYGQWYALAHAMSYRDWTENNLVWAEEYGALCMIDLDWSLMPIEILIKRGLPQHKPEDVLKKLKPIDKAQLTRYTDVFQKGVSLMQFKIEQNMPKIREILQRAQHDENRNFVPTVDQNIKKTMCESLSSILA